MGIGGMACKPARRGRPLMVALLALGLSAQVWSEDSAEAPERARDLAYGNAVYNYYQGDYFTALTQLSVAEKTGGIQGHAQHPELLRGGIMLSYGMTRTAENIFQRLLSENQDSATRNLAWFYLGKTYYLERAMNRAKDALARVNVEELSESRPDLVDEWHYLQGLTALVQSDWEALSESVEALPEGSIWQSYLQVNEALLAPVTRPADAEGDTPAEAADAIETDPAQVRIDRLQAVSLPTAEDAAGLDAEVQALNDRVSLTEAGYRLDQGDFDGAMTAFRRIRVNGPFSDQALYGFALAATESQQFGLALQALNTLAERPLFNPLVRQAPYARGYLYEQMGQQVLAREAYANAVRNYADSRITLAGLRDNLSLESVTAALRVGENETGLNLRDPEVPRDAYGRLIVSPADYSLAMVMASEQFQDALQDMHELHTLEREIAGWQNRIDVFEQALTARIETKQQKAVSTGEVLSQQRADEWIARTEAFETAITDAEAEEDPFFFLNAGQLEFQNIIAGTRKRLDRLPDGPDKQEFSEKLRRIEAYFTWWAHDTYGVNRWAARKQQIALKKAVDTFSGQRQRMNELMATDTDNQRLADRIATLKSRIEGSGGNLDALKQASTDRLLGLLEADLNAQLRETERYWRASQDALARLIDDAYEAGQETLTEEAEEAPVQGDEQ